VSSAWPRPRPASATGGRAAGSVAEGEEKGWGAVRGPFEEVILVTSAWVSCLPWVSLCGRAPASLSGRAGAVAPVLFPLSPPAPRFHGARAPPPRAPLKRGPLPGGKVVVRRVCLLLGGHCPPNP